MEATISVNGGPKNPFDPDKIAKATKKLGKQMDLERDALGQEPEFQVKSGGIAADRLRSIVERVERLNEERKALGNDITDIYAEAKSAGFDPKVLRALIKLRGLEPAEIEEQETLLDVYRRALGM